MSRFSQIAPERASGTTKKLLDAVKAKLGLVPNMVRVTASSPAALNGGSAIMRTVSLMAAALAVAVVAPLGPSARAQHEHAEHFVKCAKACADCQLQCDSCFTHCLTLLADGKKDHAKTAQLCADCPECCKTCSTLCARQSPLARPMLECCATCCDECAAACAKFPDDKHMAACATSCRECAKECRELLKHLGK